MADMASQTRTQFFRAVFNGHIDVVNECLQQSNGLLDVKDPRFGFTAAHVACARNHFQILSLLHDKGAKINEPTISDVPDGLLFFVWRGPAGSTPLSVAVQKGSTDCVRLLLSWSVDASQIDSKRKTPLHYAAPSSEIEAMLREALRSNGATDDLESKASFGDLYNRTVGRPKDPDMQLKLLQIITGQMNCLSEQLQKSRDDMKSSSAPATGPGKKTTLGPYQTFFMKEYIELKALRNELFGKLMNEMS